MFSAEVGLNLVENRLALSLGAFKFAELQSLARAPEEAALREFGFSIAVHTNSEVVVGLEA